MKKGNGGWHKESTRHSNARKYGRAGGRYRPNRASSTGYKEAHIARMRESGRDPHEYFKTRFGMTKAETDALLKNRSRPHMVSSNFKKAIMSAENIGLEPHDMDNPDTGSVTFYGGSNELNDLMAICYNVHGIVCEQSGPNSVTIRDEPRKDRRGRPHQRNTAYDSIHHEYYLNEAKKEKDPERKKCLLKRAQIFAPLRSKPQRQRGRRKYARNPCSKAHGINGENLRIK